VRSTTPEPVAGGVKYVVTYVVTTSESQLVEKGYVTQRQGHATGTSPTRPGARRSHHQHRQWVVKQDSEAPCPGAATVPARRRGKAGPRCAWGYQPTFCQLIQAGPMAAMLSEPAGKSLTV
jgi:hypothetical protein